jgi:hypothetical protein
MTGNIGQFAIKTAIVAGAIIGTFWMTLSMADSYAEARIVQLRDTIETATKIGGKQFWARIEQQLELLSDPKAELSPEKKQKLLAEIHVLSIRWRPFIQEVIAFASPDVKEPPKQ